MTREEIIQLMRDVISVEFSVSQNPGSYGGSDYYTFTIELKIDDEVVMQSTEYLTLPQT